MEAVLNLREQHGVEATQMRALTITGPHRSHSGALPRSGLDGKFSIQYCAAIALLDGAVGIDSFTDQRRFSPTSRIPCRKSGSKPRPAPQ